jgi:hypothetical protein
MPTACDRNARDLRQGGGHGVETLRGAHQSSKRERFARIGRHLWQYSDAAGDVEAANRHQEPAARKRRARSMARGNWLDCTPTSVTRPKPPVAAMAAAICSGRMRVLVSSAS